MSLKGKTLLDQYDPKEYLCGDRYLTTTSRFDGFSLVYQIVGQGAFVST